MTLSSDDEQVSTAENDDEFNSPNWWANKDRYLYNMTDANPGYVENESQVESQSLLINKSCLPVSEVESELQPLLACSTISEITGHENTPSKKSCLKRRRCDDNTNSSNVFETTFSKIINQKKVSFPGLSVSNPHLISSSDSSDCETIEPLMKKMKKDLTPHVQSKQQVALTKTLNKDGSKSLSANIYFSSSVPASSHSQDSGIFTHSQDSGVNSDNSQLFKNGSVKKKGRRKNSVSARKKSVQLSKSPLSSGSELLPSLSSAGFGTVSPGESLQHLTINMSLNQELSSNPLKTRPCLF